LRTNYLKQFRFHLENNVMNTNAATIPNYEPRNDDGSEVAVYKAQGREDARADHEGREPRLIATESDIHDLEWEFRCTRRDPYASPGCSGHKNPSARQGHYLYAKTERDAVIEMRKDFPRDIDGFDVERTGKVRYACPSCNHKEHAHATSCPSYGEVVPAAPRASRGAS
jgi:hypothetical protein